MIPLCPATAALFAPLRFPINSTDRIDCGIEPKNGNFIFDFYRESGDGYRNRCSPGVTDLINRLPEIKGSLIKGDFYAPWEVGATDSNIELINHLIPRERINFLSAEAQAVYTSIILQSTLADETAKMIANYKLSGVIPNNDLELCADKQLAGYQQIAALAQMQSSGFGLFMEQGTGKTPVIIGSACNAAIAMKKADPNAFARIIVVCPNSVRANWESEFCNFATRGGRLTVLRGNQIDRVRLLVDAFSPDDTGELYYSVVVCGYQTLWRSWESLKFIPWDLAVLDEAHNIKDSKAKQSRCCLELRDRAKQRAVLTGTPLANSIMDYYMLLEFMDKGGSGFSTEKNYRRFYGSFDRSSGFEVLTGAQNVPILQERLARKSFAISKKEALPDLPDKVYDVIECEMTPQQREIYTTVSDQLALEIENEMSRDDITRQMIVSNILTKLLRLSQITSGFVSWSEILGINGEVEQPAHYEYLTPNPKIEAALEQLLNKTDPTEKSIIWACWLPDVAYLKSACEQNGIGCCTIRGMGKDYTEDDRAEAIRRFNEDRNCKVLIGTAASGGAGLNLLGYPPGRGDEFDTDCTHIMYFSQNWSRIHRDQSEDRAHRKGTRRQVRISDICIPNTIDEQIRLRVLGKRKNAWEVADLREIMAAITGGMLNG